MTDFECFEKLKECCGFFKHNLKVDNVALVYEFACLKYGYVIVSAAVTILLACTKGKSENG